MTFIQPKQNFKNVLCIRANAVSDFRIDLAARHIERAGYEVEVITAVPFYKASQYDIVICCRPGSSMIEFLKTALLAGKRVVVDLDDDFNSIPKHNPAFNYTGAGHATYLTELRRLLNTPGVITTFASPELINRYKIDGIVIPNYFDEENPNWKVPKLKRGKYLNIGFSGTSTHREDFRIVEPTLKKLMTEDKHIRFVAQLDDEIYTRFNMYPEEQKLFIPPLLYIDYPLMYAYIDLLIVPLRDTRFNRAKSDIKLLECGVSQTAYVASRLPFYEEWKLGGLTVGDTEWEAALRSLIESPEKRKQLSTEGHVQAQARASKLVCNKWVEIVEELSR